MIDINAVIKGDVKLEFGNPEHIAVVKELQKELQKERFSVSCLSPFKVVVDASDELEAMEKALDEVASYFHVEKVVSKPVDALPMLF